MRLSVVAAAAFLCLPLLAQPTTRVEYGAPADLRSVERVFIWCEKNPEIGPEARKLLSEALPSLKFVETEAEGDVTLILHCLPAEGQPADSKKRLTSVRVARAKGDTIHLYLDDASSKEDPAEALKEVVTAVVDLLQTANPIRFGVPSKEARAVAKWKNPRVHSTAGLRPGLSKKQVLAAIGWPSKVDGKHGYSEAWNYDTSDGTMRLVFGGDRLLSISMIEKK